MATPRHGGKRFREGRFGPSVIEASLALSVIVGLTFVTMRVMNMPVLSTAQIAIPDSTTPDTIAPVGTVVVKTETDQGETRTP